jgi:hypothetical protein
LEQKQTDSTPLLREGNKKGGEIEMKGKILGICIVLLLVAILATPIAVAEPAQKIPVTAVTSGASNTIIEERTTNGGIYHSISTRDGGTVTLTKEGQAPIVGTYSEVVHLTRNTKTGETVIQNFDAVWVFTGGSFEGLKQTRITSGTPLTIEQHAVFQGTGIFEGQTLMLSQEAPPYPAIYTGILLIH